MIITVTLNPTLDKTVEIPGFAVGNVNRITSLRLDPGGKGINVSKVIRSWGGTSRAIGILGGGTGSHVKTYLDEQGIENDFVFVSADTRTNLKVIDPLNHTNTDINEPGSPVTGEVLEAVEQRLLQDLGEGDIVVLAGSVPGGVDTGIYRRWITLCNQRGAKTILDADGELFSEGLKACPYLVKPNNFELERICGKPLTTREDLVAAGKTLLDGGVRKAVISLGGEGALFLDGGQVIHGHGLQVPVLSTVGAGDSMVASLALSEQQQLPLEEAVRHAIATSAANVMCSGTQAAKREAIEPLIGQVTYAKL